MPRDIPVGNGKLLVNFDAHYRIRDIYYPHVGQENHTNGHVFRFGVWVDGRLSWVEDGSWQINKRYMDNTLVTDVELINSSLELKLVCNDTVDFHEDVYLRKMIVFNLASRERDIRFFLHHDFHIYGNSIGDTAVHDPVSMTLIHYKSKRYFLIGSCSGLLCGLQEYSTGKKESGKAEGTFKDAEDGRLSCNPIEQGSVDSTIGIHVRLAASASEELHYWIAAGKSKEDVLKLNRIVLAKGPGMLIKRTADYWRFWLKKEKISFCGLPDNIIEQYKRSLLIVRTQIDYDGAIIAANDTDILQFAKDTYSYMWPRDGALVAYALDLAGYPEITKKFFQFCADVIEKDGYLLHKYNPDKSPASSWHPWEKDGKRQLPIQEDETALVIWSLWKHFEIYRDIEFIKPLYKNLIKNSADFLVRYRDKNTGLPLPSYDLWEERHGVLTYTVSAVYAGLVAAANFTEGFGDYDRAGNYRQVAAEMKAGMEKYLYSHEHNRFVRMVNFNNAEVDVDLNIDSSMYAVFAFDVFPVDDPKVISTMNAIRDNLWCKTEVGGLARYQNDYYYQVSKDVDNVPGNPWFICTLWLAEYEIARAKSLEELDKSLEIMLWVVERALPSGVLAEQVDPYTNMPLSVSPLTWSHATFVMMVLKYLNKRESLDKCPCCGGSRSICREHC